MYRHTLPLHDALPFFACASQRAGCAALCRAWLLYPLCCSRAQGAARCDDHPDRRRRVIRASGKARRDRAVDARFPGTPVMSDTRPRTHAVPSHALEGMRESAAQLIGMVTAPAATLDRKSDWKGKCV